MTEKTEIENLKEKLFNKKKVDGYLLMITIVYLHMLEVISIL